MKMPQLDITTFSSQAFWLLVTFCVVYIVLAFLVVPRIAKVKDLRKELISNNVATAEQLRANAQYIEDEINNVIAKTKKLLHDQVIRANEECNKKFASQIIELDQELAKKAHLAEEQAKKYLQSKGFEEANKLAVTVTTQVLSSLIKIEKISKDKIVQVVQQVNNQIKSS